LFEDLDNKTTWYVAVSPFDDYTIRTSVEAVEVLPQKDSGSAEPVDSNENTDFTSLLTTPNLLAAGLVLVALLLVIGIIRTKNNNKMRNKNWELQEATWGIQDDMGWDDAPGFGAVAPIAPPPQITPQVESDLYSAAQRIETNDPYQRQAYQPQQPVLQPQNNALLSELNDTKQAQKPNIDTSFLDDLL
jgi:hypothetical protein